MASSSVFRAPIFSCRKDYSFAIASSSPSAAFPCLILLPSQDCSPKRQYSLGLARLKLARLKGVCVRAGGVQGEEASWQDDDYIVVGLAHCFQTGEDGKLRDVFQVEPIPAGALECMENGGATCFLYTIATTLGVVLQKQLSLLPKEFSRGSFCSDFEFRAKCAARTWKRPHAVEHLMHLVPKNGVKSDYNLNLDNKRVLNVENFVTDEDNIKQDLSIDVYGRKKEEPDENTQIASLYNA